MRTLRRNALDVVARRVLRAAPPTGFTLLEVILALALFVVIMGAVAAAIRLYYVNLTQSQKTLELTALARGTVNLVAGDLRSAIQFKPVDVSGLNELISSNAAALLGAGGGSSAGAAAAGGAGNAGDPASGDPASGDPTGETGGSSGDGGSDSGAAGGGGGGMSAGGQSGNSSQAGTANNSASTASDSEDPPIDRPILFGSSNQLVVDISRLPRIDQYHPVLHTSEVGSYLTLPTDLKSISYFVSFDTAGGKFNGGLFRREVDRVSLRQAGLATAFQVDAAAREIAPEVVEIAFRYFDGESWQSEWDSDSQGGFPSAIEFVMIVDPSRLRGGAGENYEYRGYNAETMRTFRCVTHLPIAEILTAEQQELAQDRSGGLQAASPAADEATDESPAAGTGNNSGGNNSGGNNSGGNNSGGNNSGGNNSGGNNSGGQNPLSGSGSVGGNSPGAGGNGPGRGGQGGVNGGQGTGTGTQGPGRGGQGPGQGGAPGSGSGGQPGGGRSGGGPGNSRGTP